MAQLRNVIYKDRLFNPEEHHKEVELKGYFHRWFKIFYDNEVSYSLYALIESSEGQMKTVTLDKIVFTGKSSDPDEDRNPPLKKMVM